MLSCVACVDVQEACSCAIEEDPAREFVYSGGEVPVFRGPRIINVGVPGPGMQASMWKRAWRDKVCIVAYESMEI